MDIRKTVMGIAAEEIYEGDYVTIDPQTGKLKPQITDDERAIRRAYRLAKTNPELLPKWPPD